jgi:hypothetical protein
MEICHWARISKWGVYFRQLVRPMSHLSFSGGDGSRNERDRRVGSAPPGGQNRGREGAAWWLALPGPRTRNPAQTRPAFIGKSRSLRKGWTLTKAELPILVRGKPDRHAPSKAPLTAPTAGPFSESTASRLGEG